MTRKALATGLAALAALIGAALAPASAQETEPLRGIQIQGDPDAPVTIIEYVSLTCPHCASWHDEVYPEVKAEYIDTGKARLEFREVYFDRFGLYAAMLARCAGDEKRYFGFVDLILERQDDWTRSEDVLAALQRLGRQGGLTDERVEACLTDSAFQKDLVEMYQEYYEDPRLTGTPTLIVNGEKVERPSFDNMAAAIEAELD
jgi:protein-disulfide isomerase